MSKTENQKLKTIYVAQDFIENSDENHAVTESDCAYWLPKIPSAFWIIYFLAFILNVEGIFTSLL